MNSILLGLILFSVSCSAIAQIFLKIGMSQPAVLKDLATGDHLMLVGSIISNGWVLGGLALYFFGAVVWLFVLARVDVSFAYPFVGLGFIVTLLLGRIVMGDVVTLTRVVGTVLVSTGVLLIAR
jgi:multidrug transporter EmrE-like cation transporter